MKMRLEYHLLGLLLLCYVEAQENLEERQREESSNEEHRGKLTNHTTLRLSGFKLHCCYFFGLFVFVLFCFTLLRGPK